MELRILTNQLLDFERTHDPDGYERPHFSRTATDQEMLDYVSGYLFVYVVVDEIEVDGEWWPWNGLEIADDDLRQLVAEVGSLAEFLDRTWPGHPPVVGLN